MSGDRTHSLILKIDASPAKNGARKFAGAINVVREAVGRLERDSSGAFVQLRKDLSGLNVDSQSIKNAAKDHKTLANAARQSATERAKLELQVASAGRVTASVMDRLYEKADRLGDSDGVRKLTSEFARLQASLATADSSLDVQQAKSRFSDAAADIMHTNRQLEVSEKRHNIAAGSARSHANEIDQLRSRFIPLYAESKKYETVLEEVARAERLGALSANQAGAARESAAAQLSSASGQMRQYGDSMRVAGYQSQNVAFQLQDIFVTAEMGMSPFRIMTQQGLVLSSVLSDMSRDAGGARGAISGLVAGVRSMVSPMALLTLAGVGGASMLLQWGMSALSAGEESRTFKDQLDDLSTAVSTYRQYADAANQSTAELSKKFGSFGGAAGEANEALATIARLDAIRQADSAVSDLTERFGGLSRTALTFEGVGGVLKEIESTFFSLRDELQLTDTQAAAVVRSLEGLATAGTMQEKVAAANRLNSAFVKVFGSVENIPESLLAVQREALLVSLEIAEIGNEVDQTNDKLARMFSHYAKSRNESAAASATARDMLATLTSQSEMTRLIATYGEDSRHVTAARVSAEREAYEETVRSLAVAESMKKELMASWDAANGVASVDMAGTISLAAGEASRLSQGLASALDLARRVAGYRSEVNHNGLDPEDPRNPHSKGRWTGGYGTVSPFDESRTRTPVIRTTGGGVSSRSPRIPSISEAPPLPQTDVADFDALNNKMRDGFKDAISGALQGDFDFKNIADGLRASLADAFAERITSAILPDSGAASEAAKMQAALASGGTQAAAAIRSAMTGGASVGAGALTRAGTLSGATMATSVTTAGITGAASMRGGIVSGSAQGAQMMATATGGGGGLESIFGNGNWLAMAMMAGSALFAGSGSSSSATSPAHVEKVNTSQYYGPRDPVPHYREGTANTSGRPAILHDNEAVIPLSRGRKVPVELGGAGSSAPITINSDVTVNVEGSDRNEDDAVMIAQAVDSRVRAIVQETLIEQSQYGGHLNRRGGANY